MAPYDARTVANFILDHEQSQQRELTQLQLLKLIYFAHGWYLAHYNKPLVTNEFEAWQHGPVVRSVRDCFKQFRDRPINIRASKLDIFTGTTTQICSNVHEMDAKFLEAICTEYSSHTAWQLSDLTHEVGSPWDRVWNSSQPVARVGLRIKNVDIRNHFTSQSRRLVLF